MTKLYTYTEAAAILKLGGRGSVARRIDSLAKRGLGLTVEAGEFQEFGSRRLLTEAGLERLRAFEPGKSGRPGENKLQAIDNKPNKLVDICSLI